jgi:hypothetical protein
MKACCFSIHAWVARKAQLLTENLRESFELALEHWPRRAGVSGRNRVSEPIQIKLHVSVLPRMLEFIADEIGALRLALDAQALLKSAQAPTRKFLSVCRSDGYEEDSENA